MKNNELKLVLLFLLGAFAILFLFSCGTRQTGHETRWNENGKDSVVHVQYVNDNGQVSSFFMNYLLFRTLFSSGGYSSVYNYYTSHPSEFQGSNYNNYRNYNYSSNPTTQSYSSPSRSNSNNGFSSGSSSSPSRSYSSPSRSSSPSKSYSSPSRSSSSPSRSSSSPSRR